MSPSSIKHFGKMSGYKALSLKKIMGKFSDLSINSKKLFAPACKTVAEVQRNKEIW